MYKSEDLPIISQDNIVIPSIYSFKLVRSGGSAANIVLSANLQSSPRLYTFLPKIIPQAIAPIVDTTSYQIFAKNNIIENVDTTDVKINKKGIYKYNLEIDAFASYADSVAVGSTVSGAMAGIDLVNDKNIEYPGILSIKAVNESNTIFILSGLIEHDIGDIVKLRFSGAYTFTDPQPTSAGYAITLNISKLQFFIENVL